jgi:hypothetical protein
MLPERSVTAFNSLQHHMLDSSQLQILLLQNRRLCCGAKRFSARPFTATSRVSPAIEFAKKAADPSNPLFQKDKFSV